MAIPLCLIASVLGYAIDKFAYKNSQLNDQSKTSESLNSQSVEQIAETLNCLHPLWEPTSTKSNKNCN